MRSTSTSSSASSSSLVSWTRTHNCNLKLKFWFPAALLEYAVILLMLKKRRKPRRTIDEGLKNLFSQSNSSSATEPAAHSSRRKQPVSETLCLSWSLLWSFWSLFLLLLLCASSLHGHVSVHPTSPTTLNITRALPLPVTCACTLSACSACRDRRTWNGGGTRTDARTRTSRGEERWHSPAKQPAGTKRSGKTEGFPFFPVTLLNEDTWNVAANTLFWVCLCSTWRSGWQLGSKLLWTTLTPGRCGSLPPSSSSST